MVPDDHLNPEEKVRAQKTIDIYNLNSSDLIAKRLGVIRQIASMNDLDEDTVKKCLHTAGFSFLVEFELKQRSNADPF